MKLYIVGPKNNGEGTYNLVAETGEALASHLCSHAGYALHDLESGRPERQKEWKKQFGTYEVIRMGDDSMTDDILIKRNEDWYKKENK